MALRIRGGCLYWMHGGSFIPISSVIDSTQRITARRLPQLREDLCSAWIAITGVFLLGLVGAGLLACAVLMPIALRGIDAMVLQEAGRGTPQFDQAALPWLEASKPGTAAIFENAEPRLVTDGDDLAILPVRTPEKDPFLYFWGGVDPFLEQIFAQPPPRSSLTNPPVLPLLIPRDARQALGSFLEGSRNPGVRAVLDNRQVGYADRFMPVDSAAGQPLEATLYLTALLLQGSHFTQTVASDIRRLAEEANAEDKLGEVETFYVDILALGSRLQWQPLADLMSLLPDRAALRRTAHMARVLEEDWVVFVAASLWTANPSEISRYLVASGKSGMGDLKGALLQGEGAVRLLIARQSSVHTAVWRQTLPDVPVLLPEVFIRSPELGAAMKLGTLFGGFLIVFLAINLFTQLTAKEKALGRPFGFTLLQASLLASAFGVTFLFFSEPLLVQSGQISEFRIQLPFPILSNETEFTTAKGFSIDMDQLTIISLSVFFGLQLIIYVICWIKVMEIRRQPIASHLKLRLLENEDHLFDAGLYIGLAGTVGALIFLALGVIGPSLMAAYASTLFGIVFVALFKICHLRPYRRYLILESQAFA